MIEGKKVNLRPMSDLDWELFEKWGQNRLALWGPYQRFQLDHLPQLRQAFQQTGLLTRQTGFLMIDRISDGRPIGFVRYTLISFPDADFTHPEIGFGITETDARGCGFASEAVRLLVDYLFSGYDVQRISAITDELNLPAQKLLQATGFQLEGRLRKASFRDGENRDMLVYGLLKEDWQAMAKQQPG